MQAELAYTLRASYMARAAPTEGRPSKVSVSVL